MASPDRLAVETDMRSRLKPKRFEHSRQVAAYAEHLAKLHGCDPEWAYVAGLYHDLGKSVELQAMKEAAEAEGVAFDEMESKSESLMHAAASAAFFKKEMKPPDNFVRAVRGHTVGAVPFCKEARILYIADFAEPTRAYEECASVRKTADRDLRLAVLETVSFKIRFLMLRNRPIHPKAVLLYNHLLEESRAAGD